MSKIVHCAWAALVLCVFTVPAGAQNFMVQCPSSTLMHPAAPTSVSGEPLYYGPNVAPNLLVSTTANGVPVTYNNNGGAIKCQQISGGDGYMTEADGNQTYMFAFGPLSGLDKIKHGQPGSDYPDEFNQPYCDPSNASYNNGQPNPYVNGGANPLYVAATGQPALPPVSCGTNGAVGYVPPAGFRTAVGLAVIGPGNLTASPTPTYVSFVVTDPHNLPTSEVLAVTPGNGYRSPPTVWIAPPAGCTLNGSTCVQATANATIANGSVIDISIQSPGNGYTTSPQVSFIGGNSGTVPPGTDAAAVMNTGVLNGNIPAPLMAMDEDDEFFLTLTNVGMIMRPDLFEQHTVHFHGYPNASAFYDGVPDASIAINIGASFTYYYLAPDAGTYFWHCHITPPEHLQMGMVGQLFVRPRQNRAPDQTPLYQVSQWQQGDLRTACYSNGESNLLNGASGAPGADILCSTPAPVAPAVNTTGALHALGNKYVYNDGDGSTAYDVDVPIQIHGFDPNFHFVGMTFNSEGFADMKDKYFLLNGRSYPDTVSVVQGTTVEPDWHNGTGIALPAAWNGGLPSAAANPDAGSNAILTSASDGLQRPSQPMSTLVVLSHSGQLDISGNKTAPVRAALRIADLDVSEYQTLASLGIPMHVVGYNAKMLRDQAGNNLDYYTNSITLGGGESLDVILDASQVPPGTYFLYTPNLDHLSNDAENFGGLMTEVVVTP